MDRTNNPLILRKIEYIPPIFAVLFGGVYMIMFHRAITTAIAEGPRSPHIFNPTWFVANKIVALLCLGLFAFGLGAWLWRINRMIRTSA